MTPRPLDVLDEFDDGLPVGLVSFKCTDELLADMFCLPRGCKVLAVERGERVFRFIVEGPGLPGPKVIDGKNTPQPVMPCYSAVTLEAGEVSVEGVRYVRLVSLGHQQQ